MRILTTQLWLCLLPSFLVGALISIIAFSKTKNNALQNALKSTFSNYLKRLTLTLSTIENTQLIKLFKDLIENEYELEFELKDDILLSPSLIVLPIFLFEPTTAKDILSKLKTQNIADKKVVIISMSLTPQAVDLCARCNYSIICGEETAKFLGEKGQSLVSNDNVKTKNSFDISKIFKSHLGKRFIVYGIILDLLSLVTFFPFYYVISGTIFIIYGLIALLFGKKQPKTIQNFDDIFGEKKPLESN